MSRSARYPVTPEWQLRPRMFENFEKRPDASARRRALTSTIVSLVVYGAIGGGVAVYASRSVDEPVEEDAIEVTFKAAPEPAAAPPPPPPPVVTPSPPPPEGMKTRKVKAPTTDPLKPPDVVPDKKLDEADPSEGVAVVDTGTTDPNGAGTGAAPEAPPPPPPPPPPPKKRADPINLPENARPPEPSADNEPPEYPASKRAEGVEAMVVLKIVVTETGAVGSVQVLKGDEPFAGAAVAAVKTWRFTPAMVDGAPAAVFRIIKIPFRIKG